MNPDYLDPHGVWRVPASGGGCLTYDRLAALRHVVPLWLLLAGCVLVGGPFFMLAWGRAWVANWPNEANWVLGAIAGAGAFGVFLPILAVKTWQILREARRGPWLFVDTAARTSELRPHGLRVGADDLQWSVQYDQRRDRDCIGVARRAQLVLSVRTQAGPRQFYVTVRYGRNALQQVRQMAEDYATFTGSVVAEGNAFATPF